MNRGRQERPPEPAPRGPSLDTRRRFELCFYMRFIGVIPARFDSSRFPGKVLAEIAGLPMIQRVYERVVKARKLAEVWVATDDERVRSVVAGFGGNVMMTSASHPSGTDRVAEAAGRLEGDVFVNVQGDEPLISPDTVDAVCFPFLEVDDLKVSTACVAIREARMAKSRHVVKVVTDREGRALYFSRSPIPFGGFEAGRMYKHLGIYAYRKDFLGELSRLKQSPLEKLERLEQLRFLENGVAMRVVRVEEDSLAVDTLEDLERVRPLVENDSRMRSSRIARSIKGR